MDAECIAKFTEALRLQPDLVNAYVGRAACYFDEGNAAPAVQDYTAAIRLSPEDPQLYIARGSAETLIGNYSQARSDYKKASSFASANPGQMVRSAEGLGQMGFVRDALAVLDEGIGRYGNFWDLHRYRGEIEGLLGEDSLALGEFRQAVGMASGSDLAFVLDTRASFYMKRHNYQLALADYDKGIFADATDYFLFEGRAQARLALGNLTGAVADFSAAINKITSPPGNRDPILAKLFEERARVYLQQGDANRAADDIRSALRVLPPEDTDSRNRLQQLLVATAR
jgi:tetratricopeptide (TPR) repeat protein